MNNKKSILGLLLVSFIVFSCDQNKKSDKKPNHEQKTEVTTKQQAAKKYFKTHNAGDYSITFESDNSEVSILKISTKGLDNEENDSLEIEGSILETYMTDLNQDGFKEFFITVSPADDSGNIDIIGIASNMGKSFSDIAINESAELRDPNTDKLNIDANGIVREFSSNGKMVKYGYDLTEGEAGYVLTAKKQ